MESVKKRFKKILVANRGEIAIRILRAASELKLRTVAIYTHEDRYSQHRYKADEAYQIGMDHDPLKPYLDIEEILRVALSSIKPTLLISGTLEQPTPWLIHLTT